MYAGFTEDLRKVTEAMEKELPNLKGHMALCLRSAISANKYLIGELEALAAAAA